MKTIDYGVYCDAMITNNLATQVVVVELLYITFIIHTWDAPDKDGDSSSSSFLLFIRRSFRRWLIWALNQQFLTMLSDRPGISLAIWVHLFPY